ncbi:MAG TPA: flagellar motor protein [Bryobacteraceae bacterium]|nr:flagellar motor protein [Bryobacteraceae bacterium]
MPQPKQSAPKPAARQTPPKKGGSKPDIGSFGGLVLALAGIMGGLMIEGGKVSDISQVTAAMIVLGGTFGATMISTPFSTLLGALRRLPSVFFEGSMAADAMVEEIIGYATKARKNGIVALESEAEAIADPFLRKALNLAVDGTDLQELRKMMELEIAVEEQRGEAEAKVFESAGGFAPTIGIIGAVLGLIQVMKHLANIEEVGRGIAVAFVATVYGVGVANILLLPAATKIKARIKRQTDLKELILEGVGGIVEGLNPKLVRSKLEAYTREQASAKPSKAKPDAKAKAAQAEPAKA